MPPLPQIDSWRSVSSVAIRVAQRLVKVRREGDTITFAEPAPYFTGDYADVAGVEYAMLSGERAVVLRPVNPDRTVRRVEVITGFYRLLAETVN